ncbi:autophagy protein [Xylariales sp. PMI_506]|nr:autophagy protein [Xylariales sp. PMI_506]
MSNAQGIIGADAAALDLELKSHALKDPVVLESGKGSTGSFSGAEETVESIDVEPVTTKWEIWAWWLYYFGNNSAGTLSYAPLIFQSLLSQAGFNGNDPSQDCSDANAPCLVKFGTSNVNINSVVLICSGVAFAVQGALLILFGSLSDYGPWRRWVLWISTLVCWAVQFAFLGLKDGSQFKAATALYILTTLSYNMCQAFWTPSLPLLARNTPEAREVRRAYSAGEISESERESSLMLQRNKLSNISFGFLSVGYTITLLIALGVAYGLHANDSDANNTRAAVVIVGLATGVWVVAAVPWFFLEKTRSQKLPSGEKYFSVAMQSYWTILKAITELRQTWLYLLGFFFISDGWATTVQIYGTCQNAIVAYSTTVSTELYIMQGFANIVGIGGLWLMQRHYKLPTKVLVIITGVAMIILAVWGCIGIGTTKFGIHNTWEVWVWSAVACALQAPFIPASATMLADVIPKGKEVAFFALYALVNKSTAWIGPLISGVIIDRTGNTWMGFPFALALTIVGFVMICLVKVDKAKEECDAWSEKQGKSH